MLFQSIRNWYANWISPCSIRIRPFLRKASFIITLALCLITLLWSIAYFLPLSVSVLFYTLIALLICTALLFLLYMITLQFHLELTLTKHWLNILPHIILLTLFIGYCTKLSKIFSLIFCGMTFPSFEMTKVA